MKFLPKRAALISAVVVLSFVINTFVTRSTANFFNAELVEVAVILHVSVISHSYFSIIPIRIVTDLVLKVMDAGDPLSNSGTSKSSKKIPNKADEQISISKVDSKTKRGSLKFVSFLQKDILSLQQPVNISYNFLFRILSINIVLLFLLFLMSRKNLYPDVINKINEIIRTRPFSKIWSCFFIGGTNGQFKNFSMGAINGKI